MDIVKWDPFKELSVMRDQMDRLMVSFFRENPLAGGSWAPDLDVSETDDEILVMLRSRSTRLKASLASIAGTTVLSETVRRFVILALRRVTTSAKSDSWSSSTMRTG